MLKELAPGIYEAKVIEVVVAENGNVFLTFQVEDTDTTREASLCIYKEKQDGHS